jgi:hypothetical protein
MQARSSGAHHGATLRALQRNAAVVLESIGAVYDNRRSGDYLSCDHPIDGSHRQDLLQDIRLAKPGELRRPSLPSHLGVSRGAPRRGVGGDEQDARDASNRSAMSRHVRWTMRRRTDEPAMQMCSGRLQR